MTLLGFFAGAVAAGQGPAPPAPPPDQPGTLTEQVTQSGRDYNFLITVSDPDGIRSVDAASLTARDGQVADITSSWIRADANTFTHTDSRRNNRWRSGTASVTYTDANGVQATLTDTWSI